MATVTNVSRPKRPVPIPGGRVLAPGESATGIDETDALIVAAVAASDLVVTSGSPPSPPESYGDVLVRRSDDVLVDGQTLEELTLPSSGSGGAALKAPPEYQGFLDGPAGGRNLWPSRPLSGDGQTRPGTVTAYWVKRPIFQAIRDPFLVCANSTTDNQNETTAGLDTITVRSALWVNPTVAGSALSGGSIYPVTYSGSASPKSIAPGAVAISDRVVGLRLAPTDLVMEIMVVTGATGKWPCVVGLRTSDNPGEGFLVNPSSGAQTTALTTGAGVTTALNGTGNAYAYCSSALCGTYIGGRKRSASLHGDSIFSTVDPADADKAYGVRGLEENGVPYVRLSTSGGQLAHVATSPVRLALAALCSDAILQGGVNDIIGQADLATMQGFALDAAAALRDGGAQRVYVGTITPTTAGSAGAQTQVPGTAARIPYNDWVRAGMPTVDGAPVAIGTSGASLAGDGSSDGSDRFDAADVIESARNSGVFKTAYFGDGVHPTSAGVLALVDAIPRLGYDPVPAVAAKRYLTRRGAWHLPQFGTFDNGGGNDGGFSNASYMSCIGLLVQDPGLTVDQLAVHLTGAGSAGAVIRLCAFTVQQDTPAVAGTVGALIADFGTVDATSTGTKETAALGTPAVFPLGVILLGLRVEGAPSTVPNWKRGFGPSALSMSRAAAGDIVGQPDVTNNKIIQVSGSTNPAPLFDVLDKVGAPVIGYHTAPA